MWIIILVIIVLFFFWLHKQTHTNEEKSTKLEDRMPISSTAESVKTTTNPSKQAEPVKTEEIVEQVESKNEEPEVVKKEITHFKVAGVTKHELKKAVSFARKEGLIDDPYNGMTTKEIKDAFNDLEFDSSDKIFETNLNFVLDKIEFVPEPDNKFDSHAIKIIITIQNQQFFIGYVPAYMSERMSSVFDSLRQNGTHIDYDYSLTGGKYKTVDYDPDDDDYTSDTPKLKVSTQTEDYGFNIKLYAYLTNEKAGSHRDNQSSVKKATTNLKNDEHSKNETEIAQKNGKISGTKETVAATTSNKNIDKKHIKVVGTSFTDAEKIFRNVLKDTGDGIWNVGGMHTHEYKLTIQPDPENKYDKHAIAVISNYSTPQQARIKRSGQIGYLPKGLSLELENPVEVNAEVQEGYGKFGVTVDLSNFDF